MLLPKLEEDPRVKNDTNEKNEKLEREGSKKKSIVDIFYQVFLMLHLKFQNY